MDVRDPNSRVKKRTHPWAGGVSPYSLDVKSHHKVRDAGEPEGTGFRSTEIKFALPHVSVFSSAFEEKLSVCPRDHFATSKA